MGCLLETFVAFFAKAVVTSSPQLLRLQPTIFRQAKNRCTDQPLIDAELAHYLDQTAKPYDTASRRDRISKDLGEL